MERLQGELDALAVRLRRSLTLDGPDGALLAHSTQGDDADAARVTSILRRRVAPEILAFQDRHLHRPAPDGPATGPVTDPVPVPANPELGMAARLGLPIRDPRRDGCLGYLWMLDSATPLTAPELVALRAAATRLADLLAAPGSSGDRRDVDRLVRRLYVDGRTDAFDQLRDAVPALVDGQIQLAAAVPTTPARTGPATLGSAAFSALANALTPALRDQPAFVGSHVAPDHLLVLLHRRSRAGRSGRGGGAAVERLLDELVAVAERCVGPEFAVVLGIGEPTPFAARSARRSGRQALAAAELAALDPALPRRTRWVDLGGYRSILDPRPDGRALSGLDDAGASAGMLRLTLETYLDLGGDVQATAARLTLHRSSLYYRLDRIAQLLDVDLGNGLTRLELHLALKAGRATRRRLT